jgi:hypothetical protein
VTYKGTGDVRSALNTDLAEHERKRNLGRHRRRLYKNTKMDLQEISTV